MSKSFIFNMGYDTSHVHSVLSKESLEPGSSVILLVPPGKTGSQSSDKRQENAIHDISNYLSSLDLNVELETMRLKGVFDQDLLALNRFLSGLEGEVCLSLSGGSRDILIPLTLAASYNSQNIEKTYFRSDLNSGLNTFELPDSLFGADSVEKELLELAAGEPKTADQLSQRKNTSKSTVYRKLRGLKENGLIEKTEEGYQPTLLGQILIEKL
ncbi:CRISPR-associated CARF protein Csa3 [Candidatus Nanohalococcus occultus]